jgi:hypothetical protein
MIELLFAAALASTPTGAVSPDAIPTSVTNLKTVHFRKPVHFAERHELNAERIAKAANCKLPVSERWVHARIEAAVLVSPDGKLKHIVPVERGCLELERYMVKHLKKYGDKAGPISTSGKTAWYKTAMHFRWPE